MNGWRSESLGTTVDLLLGDDRALPEAEALLLQQLVELDDAINHRRDSELTRLRPGRQRISSVLAGAVAAALGAAEATDGLMDPTRGPAPLTAPLSGWRNIHLDGDVLDLPDLQLELGATARAWAADRAARDLAALLGTAVLVSFGGDLAVGGGSWPVSVGDPVGPYEVVEVRHGLATSGTSGRTWLRSGRPHLLDPRTSCPVEPVWRSVTVAAASCLEAHTAATAAVLLGPAASHWLDALPARFVDAAGTVTRTSFWPGSGM